MKYDQGYVLEVLQDILGCDSPSGYCDQVMDKIESYALALGLSFTKTQKGNGIIEMKGKDDYVVGVCGHVDTLGAMVKGIKDNGRLAFTPIGSPILASLDSELCRIYTRDQKVYSGTFFANHPAKHVYDDASDAPRDMQHMEVILDEIVNSKDDVKALGIDHGDYICIDPKTVITKSGFIKSRFLDDKLSVAIMLGALKYFVDNHIIPRHTIKVCISTYEEVGHGMSFIPEDISEMLAVDMGCIGDDLQCLEQQVSICTKDSSGPYDYHMVTRLVNLAKANDIDYALDVYPMYSSDVSAALRGGHDIKGALIGAGVFASHGYERSHIDGMINTLKLLIAYLQ